MYFSPAENFDFLAPKQDRFLKSFQQYLKSHLLSGIIAGIFLLGIFLGAILVKHSSAETLMVLRRLIGNYVEQRRVLSFSGVVSSTFFSIFSSLLILFFCGFCTIAQLIILAIPFLKGLGYGFSVGMLYAEHGTKAIAYVTVLMLPAMVLGALLLVAASRSSLKMSISLLHTTLNDAEQNSRQRMKRYVLRYLLFTGICLLIAIADAVVYQKFNGLFFL